MRTAPSKDRTSWVQTPKSYRTGLGPSIKLTEWQAHPWLLFRKPKTSRLARKRHHLSRRASPGPPFFIVLVHLQLLLDREPWHRSSPFMLAPAGEAAIGPTQINARLRRLLQFPQPGGIDGFQVEARLPHGSSTLQDGDTGIRLCSHQKSGVDSVHRHPRRISTCPDASSRLEVSALCGQQESLPIHLSALRIGNVTSRVHQALTTSRGAVKAARCEATRLLRRLADPCRFSRTGAAACPDDHQGAPVSWLDHQLREVRPHSKSGLPVHRDAVQHSTIHSGGPTEDGSQKSSPFTNTGWPTQISQPAICTD